MCRKGFDLYADGLGPLGPMARRGPSGRRKSIWVRILLQIFEISPDISTKGSQETKNMGNPYVPPNSPRTALKYALLVKECIIRHAGGWASKTERPIPVRTNAARKDSYGNGQNPVFRIGPLWHIPLPAVISRRRNSRLSSYSRTEATFLENLKYTRRMGKQGRAR